VPEQSRLHVLLAEWLAGERIVVEVDLADEQLAARQ
jgi:hypothetical protein